jgi:uncharacterized protein YndB with AHSA1/START domain
MTTSDATQARELADRLETSVIVKAPPARVWQAISDAGDFGRWFGVALDGPFVAKQPIRGSFGGVVDEDAIMAQQRRLGLTPSKVKMPEGSIVFATVERIEPSWYLSFRWVPYGIDAEADLEHEPTTLVEITLGAVEGGTRVTFAESGFDQVPAHRRARAFRMNEAGWAAQAENLRRHVETA